MKKPSQNLAGTVSAILALTRKKKEVTVKQCMDLLEERSLAIGILLFSLVNSLPMPGIPGVSTITGIPIILLGAQMMTASKEMWLPKRIQSHRLRPGKLLRALERILPHLKKMEKVLKPRLLWLSGPIAEHFHGLVFVVMGTLLALPIPGVNFPPGLSMSLLAIGIIARDGVVIVLGLLGVAAVCAAFVSLFIL